MNSMPMPFHSLPKKKKKKKFAQQFFVMMFCFLRKKEKSFLQSTKTEGCKGWESRGNLIGGDIRWSILEFQRQNLEFQRRNLKFQIHNLQFQGYNLKKTKAPLKFNLKVYQSAEFLIFEITMFHGCVQAWLKMSYYVKFWAYGEVWWIVVEKSHIFHSN